jgi:hypothetical protein
MTMDPIAYNRYQAILSRVEKIMNAETRFSRYGGRDGKNDKRRDYNDEYGYPETPAITLGDYQELYDRNPIAKKVVELLPRHCWQVHPEIIEDEDPDNETEFEKVIMDLGNKLRGQSWYKDDEGDPVWEYLSRVDKLAGIGHYGVLLLGVTGERVGNGDKSGFAKPLELSAKGGVKRDLIYLRVFPEWSAIVKEFDNDQNSPRYGLPITYHLAMDDTSSMQVTPDSAVRPSQETIEAHWTRVIHVTDEVMSNEVFHIPRMRPVYNNLLDLGKLYGGSAEMYFRGALPGYAFETHPQLGADVEIDAASLQEQMEYYMNGFQRWLSAPGTHVNSLAPQVVDPTPQIDVQVEAVCINADCPKRIFVGSERGELASSQDTKHWNKVISARRSNHLTPKIIVPFIDRLILAGVLPIPPDGYSVNWPIPETLSPLDQATRAQSMAQAIVTYVTGDGFQVIPPMFFFTMILGFTNDEATAIMEVIEEEDRLPLEPAADVAGQQAADAQSRALEADEKKIAMKGAEDGQGNKTGGPKPGAKG